MLSEGGLRAPFVLYTWHMALSSSRVDDTVFGDQKVTVADFTFDNAYPSPGGEAVSPVNDLGLQKVNWAICTVKSATGGLVNVANVHYDRANNKLVVFDETPAEVANGADLSTLVVQVVAFGY